MKIKIVILSILAMSLLAACNKAENTPEAAGKSVVPVSITGAFAVPEIPVTSAPATRADFVDPTPADPKTATWEVRWKVGDEIRVFNQIGSEYTVIYEVTAVNSTTGEATFSLKAGEDVSKFGDGTVFYAAHGGKSSEGYSYLFAENTIATGLPTYKSIYENTINNSFFITVAKATINNGELSFVFHNVTSYIRVTVPAGMEYDLGELYMTGSGYPSGYFTVVFETSGNGIDSIGNRTGGGSSNTPHWYGEGDSKVTTIPYPEFPAGVYYLPVRPGSTRNRFVAYNTEGTKTLDVTPANTITVGIGKIYDIGTIPTAAQ